MSRSRSIIDRMHESLTSELMQMEKDTAYIYGGGEENFKVYWRNNEWYVDANDYDFYAKDLDELEKKLVKYGALRLVGIEDIDD